ncbi:hypothetical protein MKX01_015624 [Papaver californicum]|nr:hypothetical protein MKX01_015624 [Papaver californicum]
MEAACTSNLQNCSWIAPQKIRQKPSGFLELPQRWGEDRKQRMMLSPRITKGSAVSKRQRLVGFEIKCCCRNSEDSALEPGRTHTFVDEPKILKISNLESLQKKAQEVAPYLNGRCIYLVGLMLSGKTTIGKILSEVLGYSFFDSDKLVEQAVGMTSVAQIFEEHSETFFRDNESEVLRELSLMRRLVVAAGGGAVIRPINCKGVYQLTKGVSVPSYCYDIALYHQLCIQIVFIY